MTEHVAVWLNDLAIITAGNAPLADSRAKVAALASMLATEFPPEAFCRDSLQHVAAECTFFPSYAELTRVLRGWLKDQPSPFVQRITDACAGIEANQAKRWLARLARGDVPNVATSLDVLRQHSPGVFQRVITADPSLRRIARERGWLQREPRAEIVSLRPAPAA